MAVSARCSSDSGVSPATASVPPSARGDGDGDRVPGQADRLAQPLQQPVGDPPHPCVVRGAQQDGELVAAQAGDAVAGAHARGEPAGDGDEQLVAGRVAEGVVDRLEAVEVDEQHRRRGTRGRGRRWRG
jgi:hypothetical protein